MDNKDPLKIEIISMEAGMEVPIAILCANLRRLYKYAKKGPGDGFWFVGSMIRCFKVLSDMPLNFTTGKFYLEMIDKMRQFCDEFKSYDTVFLGFSQIINLAIGNLTTAFVSLWISVKKHKRR